MRLVTEGLEEAAAQLDSDIGRLNELRDDVEVQAMRLLLNAMREIGWTKIRVEPEDCSTIESATQSDGTEITFRDLSDKAIDELTEDSINIVGWCPQRLFTYEAGWCHVTTERLVKYIDGMTGA